MNYKSKLKKYTIMHIASICISIIIGVSFGVLLTYYYKNVELREVERILIQEIDDLRENNKKLKQDNEDLEVELEPYRYEAAKSIRCSLSMVECVTASVP